MATQTHFAPAKLNLFLAITGRRPDGFNELVSVVAPIALGDTLVVEPAPAGTFTLTSTDAELACDESNLVLKAARAFVAATAWKGGAAFRLEKRVPMGAGLGGGSSDAVAALRGLNALAGNPLSHDALLSVAATLGSDCPLFLYDAPVVMRGRGERIQPLDAAATVRLKGRRILVFKPAFGIPTAWSYQRLRELAATDSNSAYLPAAAAEKRIADWVADAAAGPESLLFNTLERPAFEKHLALPVLLDLLQRLFGLAPRMTGSGSACFAFLPDASPVDEICAVIRASWGDSAFIIQSHIA